jgi:hypothetical protein
MPIRELKIGGNLLKDRKLKNSQSGTSFAEIIKAPFVEEPLEWNVSLKLFS